MKANLHIHTTNSDGTKTVSEINQLAQQFGFDLVAITDHDTVEAIDEINALNTPIQFMIGVEMSCKYAGEDIHILGYFGNHITEEVRVYFKKVSAERILRCQKIIKNLKDYYDIEISYEDVKKKADGVIARPHIAQTICEKYGCTFDEAFDKYIGNKAKAYVPYEVIGLEDAINFLKEHQALVILAHPIWIKKFDFHDILDFGFDGIEVYHPDQSKEYSQALKALAEEKGMLITGGSDYHGDITNNRFEQSYIEGETLETFLTALNQKQKTLTK